MKKRLSVCLRLLSILSCIAIIVPVHSQNISDQPGSEDTVVIKAARMQILSFIESKDWEGLRSFTKTAAFQQVFERYVLLDWQEKVLIEFLYENYIGLLKTPEWSFMAVGYKVPFKNKFRYYRKTIPPDDSLRKKLYSIFLEQGSTIKDKINTDNSLTTQQKNFLILKTDYYILYIIHDKRQQIKQFDKQYKVFMHSNPRKDFPEKKQFKSYSKRLKTGAFFGGGVSVGQWSGGTGKLFRTTIGYQTSFDVYGGRIGWYLHLNIANSKNKIDTAFKQVSWPKGTKNTLADFQAGVAWVALKQEHVRWVIKAGIGTFSYRPLKIGDNRSLTSINLQRFPCPSLGTTIDIGSFNNRLISKPYKAPIGIRVFYQHYFPSFKSKYPAFPANYHSFGLLFGLAG